MLTDRIHYKPGDTVTLQTKNTCTLVGEIDNASVVQGSLIAAGFGGFMIIDQVTQAASVFTVASNPLDVAVGGGAGAGGMTGGTKWTELAAQLAANGQTLVELPFWSPADCMNLDWSTQPGGAGYSGQTHYPENDANLIALIQQCHALGIAVVAYANEIPCGPAGWEWAQHNPTLCIRDPFGNLAPQNPALLAAWGSWSTAGLPGTGALATANLWQQVQVDYSNPAAIEAMVGGLQVAVKRYGFDAVRLDGFPDVPGNASATIGNAVAIRQGLEGLCLTGANFGKSYPADAHAAVYVSGGGLALSEDGGTWQDGLAINSQGGNWYQCNAPYSFPAHPMYGQGLSVSQNQWLLRWSACLWDRSAYVVTTSPSVGSYVKSRRGSDGLRYDVLFFTQPGTYQLPSAAFVTTPEGGDLSSSTVAVIKSFGIAVWKIDDLFPAGTVTVPCNRGSTGYNPPLGHDGRQWRPDLSTGPYPFLGFASISPIPQGSWNAVFRLWWESDPRGAAIHMRVEDNVSGKDLVTLDVGNGCHTPISSGWGYCDYRLPFTGGGDLQASCWPDSGYGKLHLNSVSFVPA